MAGISSWGSMPCSLTYSRQSIFRPWPSSLDRPKPPAGDVEWQQGVVVAVGDEKVLLARGAAEGGGVIGDVTEAAGNADDTAINFRCAHAMGEDHLAALAKAHEKKTLWANAVGIAILLREPAAPSQEKIPAVLKRAAKALSTPAYKKMGVKQLADLDWSVTTPFRQKVLEALFIQVPWGMRVSYTDLAILAGSPKATRAVASTMRHNPFPVLIPCHRVVARNGLGGFMGNVEGAMDRKVAMLDLEGKLFT